MSDCLILNSDANPVSMIPLSVISWQESIKYMVLDKATVLSWHEDWVVHSAYWETKVPAVIMLTEYMKKKNAMRFSKGHVLLRDMYICQYCGDDVNKRIATLDHVLPVSHGGKTVWENVVTACAPCNSSKGNNKKIKPKKMPYKPGYYELVEKRKKFPFEIRHPDWELYLGV